MDREFKVGDSVVVTRLEDCAVTLHTHIKYVDEEGIYLKRFDRRFSHNGFCHDFVIRHVGAGKMEE